MKFSTKLGLVVLFHAQVISAQTLYQSPYAGYQGNYVGVYPMMATPYSLSNPIDLTMAQMGMGIGLSDPYNYFFTQGYYSNQPVMLPWNNANNYSSFFMGNPYQLQTQYVQKYANGLSNYLSQSKKTSEDEVSTRTIARTEAVEESKTEEVKAEAKEEVKKEEVVKEEVKKEEEVKVKVKEEVKMEVVTKEASTTNDISDSKLNISGSTDYLKSKKKTDGQYANMDMLKSCLENAKGFTDKNVQIFNESGIYSFRDYKKKPGVTFVEKGTAYFVEERELIKLRDESCKNEIKKALEIPNLEKSKISCSIRFKVGDTYLVVNYKKSNLLIDSPEYSITDADADYESAYLPLGDELSRVNYKNLYLGIEETYKDLTADVLKCSKNKSKVYGSDAFIGKATMFAGSCDALLLTGWKEGSFNPQLSTDLKEAISSCKNKFKIPVKGQETAKPGANISR